MEELLTNIVEQNKRMIGLAEHTAQYLHDIHELLQSNLKEINSQLKIMESSSNVSSIESALHAIEVAIRKLPAAI